MISRLQGDNVLWVTLSSKGFVQKAVYFQGRYFLEVDILSTEEIPHFHSGNNIPLNTIVLDGVTEETNCERSNSRAQVINMASAKGQRPRITLGKPLPLSALLRN